MNFKTEKNLKIVNEIMAYCYHFDTDNISVNIKTLEDMSFIEIKAIIKNFPKGAFENLNNALNTPRQREVEQYYWQLGGECEFDSELTLVGMMTDKAYIDYEKDTLFIKLQRKSIA